jgi:hypothetical protein
MFGSESTGHKFGWFWMGLDSGQNRTTAAAAAAHDNHFFRIVRLEYELGLFGRYENLCYFRLVNITGGAVADIVIRPFAEYETRLFR